MSAIAAIFNLNGATVDPQLLDSMNESVAHRGPDGITTWTDGSVGFGMCLLASSPESKLEQMPLVTGNGKYAVVLDGRIDNRDELRRLLNIEAALLPAIPDSELLLMAYRKWDERCVERMRGDYGFIIWDAARREMFCGRDPIGVRMFHYYYDGNRFIAATEVSQILAVVTPNPDQTSLAMFLDARSLPVDRTFLEGVKKLPGGYRMRVSNSGLHTEAFWNPDPSDVLRLHDDREYEENFLELFKDSIKSRLRGYDPIAISLSGGMDSSSILALAESMRSTSPSDWSELRFYSNVYTDLERIDESDHIRSTVNMYGTQGRLIESGDLSDESLGTSPLARSKAEPYVAPHEESHRHLFAEVQKDGANALLTGLGGDEVFSVGTGYLADLVRSFKLRAVRREWRYFNRKIWLKAAAVGMGSALFRSRTQSGSVAASWIQEPARQLIDEVEEQNRSRSRTFKSHHFQEVEDWVQTRGGLPGYTWMDVTAAEYGLEPRHPFMDSKLAEFLVSVPPELKFRHGYNKRLLRRAMKGILPESVRNRRYKTYFTPLFDAKAARSAESIESDLFDQPVLGDMGVIDANELRRTWRVYQQETERVDDEGRMTLWAAITLEQWLRRYFVADGDENETGAAPSQRRLRLLTQL